MTVPGSSRRRSRPARTATGASSPNAGPLGCRKTPHASLASDEEGAVDVNNDAAVADLFALFLKWDFVALVARGGAIAEVSEGNSALKPLPLVFKDADVSESFHRNWRI